MRPAAHDRRYPPPPGHRLTRPPPAHVISTPRPPPANPGPTGRERPYRSAFAQFGDVRVEGPHVHLANRLPLPVTACEVVVEDLTRRAKLTLPSRRVIKGKILVSVQTPTNVHAAFVRVSGLSEYQEALLSARRVQQSINTDS